MAQNVLYGADNRPIREMVKAKAGSPSAWDALTKIGVELDEVGGMRIPPEVLRRIRQERMRRVALTSVPNTPRNMQRDAGGIAVAKGSSRRDTVSLEGLRRIRERAPILQVIHSARLYQVRHLCRKHNGKKGTVGWRVVHKDFHEPGKVPPESIKPYIARAEKLLEHPSPQYEVNSLRTVMGALVEDFLTINRPCVEIIHSLIDPKRIVQFKHIDGALVWPTLLWLEKWKSATPGWAGRYRAEDLTENDQLELASAALQWDLVGARYALVRDGLLEGVLKPGDAICAPMVNRTDITVAGYPPSHVEQAIDLVTAFIRAFDYNSNFFTRGMMAEFILAVRADYHDDDIDAFVDMWREATQGVDAAWQPPILPVGAEGDVTKIDLRQSNREMMFEVFFTVLLALAAAIYRMDTSPLNARPWDASGGSHMGNQNREQEITLAKEEGLQGDVQHLTDEILNPLIQRCHPDLMVKWEYGDDDPTKEAELFDKRTSMDWSRNDVRIMDGNAPRGFWLSDDDLKNASDEEKEKYQQNPWNWPKDTVFAGAIQAANQLEFQKSEMQQNAAGQPGQPGQPGPGAGPGQDDDPYKEDRDGFGGAPDDDDGYGQPTPRTPFGKPPGGAGGAAGAPPGGGGPPKPSPPSAPMQKGGRRPVRVVVYDDLET